MHWTLASIPDQTGRTAVVTGASSGIGAVAAEALAAHGAHVIMAVRDAAKGEAVRAHIAGRRPHSSVSVAIVDMADLASIRAFAARIHEEDTAVDILLNNAGLGMQAHRATTADGFERQFATNHLGQFALTGLLVPALLRASAPRVVAIASIAHRGGRIDFDDPQGQRSYKGGKAYSQSKLANILFARELDRRSRAAGSSLVSVAAHPGISSTGFVAAIGLPRFQRAIGEFGIRLIGQDATHGAMPGLYAATMPDVQGGQYWGPDGFMEIRGAPRLAKIAPPGLNEATAARLWTLSEDLTGVVYDLHAA